MAVSIGLVLCGCSMQRAFTYPLQPIQLINPVPPPVKIAVLPAKDFRRSENTSATMAFAYVPLFPFGWVTYERPEAASTFISIRQFNMNASEDIAKAIAQHIERAGYVKSAFFDYGGGISQADYVLETDLRSTRYEGSLYTYCISIMGAYLWFFGLPAGSSTVDLWIDLRLKNLNGNTVWSHSFKGSHDFVQGLYYGFGRDMEPLALSLQAGLDEALRSNPLPRR
jgi:hypothetical protein